jgi:hypothetical protein
MQEADIYFIGAPFYNFAIPCDRVGCCDADLPGGLFLIWTVAGFTVSLSC